jgi:predicted metal-dependent peptidase
MELHHKLEDLLLKAKIEIMSRSVFVSTIALSLEHKITDEVPTAATNGKVILYNPDFIAKLAFPELVGLMAHECWHVAFNHLGRRSERDPMLWNIAGDHVINLMLLSENYALPKDGLHDAQFTDKSTEEVYDIIYNDEDLQKQYALGDNHDLIEDLSPEEHQDIIDTIVRAQTQSKIAGKDKGEIPSEIARMIDEILNPKLDWKELLYRFLTAKIKDEYTWNRPNRRFMPSTYLPSSYSNGLGNITIAIDTSGSVTQEELTEFLTEIQSIKDTFKPQTLTVIDCDSEIHNVFEVEDCETVMDLQFNGGGGTSFLPVLNYVNERGTDALVYFTDLYGEENLDEVDYPIIWICTSDHPPNQIGETVYL